MAFLPVWPEHGGEGFRGCLEKQRMNTKLHLFRPSNQNNVAVYSDLDNWLVSLLG